MTSRGTTHFHSGWAAVFLPFLVGIIPLLILHFEAAGLAKLSRDNAVQKWLGIVRPLSERFRERSSPEFWLEEGLRRITSHRHGTAAGNPAAQTISNSISALRRWGLTGLNAWAATKDSPGGSGQLVLLEGPNLRNDFRVFFRGLLRELSLEAQNAGPGAAGESWTSRLKATFGDGVPTELFTGPWRGRAFFITFQHRFGLAAWDTLRAPNDEINGAIFLFWPLDLNFARKGVELALRHWSLISPSPEFIPAGIDLPAPGTRARRKLFLPFAAARDTSARRAMHALGRNLKAVPVSPGSFTASQDLKLGTLDLKALDTPVTDGSTWLFPLPLPPLSGLAGVLISPAPEIPPPFISHLLRIGSFSLAFAFLMLAALLSTGRPLPALSVRSILLLWLIMLAAIPAALLLAAQERLTADQSSNRRDELRSTLYRHLERIDTGSSSVTQRFIQTCREIIRNPFLPSFLDKAVGDEAAGNIMLDSLESRCASAGMELSGIFVYGHGGFKLTRVSKAINPDTASRLCWYHEVLAAETLSRIAPHIAKEHAATPTKRKSSAAEMGSLDILARNDNFLGPSDIAYTYRLGNRHTLRYYNFIYHRGGARYMVFFLWTQEQVYRSYLASALARLKKENPDLGICAFRQTASNLKLESAAASPGQIGDISAAARNLPESNESLSETVLFEGKSMPDYVLGVTTSLEPLNRAGSNDLMRSLLIFFCMFAILIGAGILLSGWLANPVRRMSGALRRVSAGDLETQVNIKRADELGDTAGILDTMIGWLRERRAMSRFVSAQVLDVVSRGDLNERENAARTQAALLVTDVRSFTTLSESHSAPEIFAMLNRHLAEMTSIIQQHGGSIDRFIGDAIQAVFLPTPEETPDGPSRRALLAGYEMMQAHRRLQGERAARDEFTYGIGVGIDQGEVVTGILGDPQVRLDFTVLGEPLKHASDLEARSKSGRYTLVVVSDSVKNTVGTDFVFHRLPMGESDPADSAWELVQLEPGTCEMESAAPAGENAAEASAASSVQVAVRMEAPGKRFSATSFAIALLLWITPLFLMLTATRDLDTSSMNAIGSRVRTQLRQDMQIAEQITDPHVLSHTLIQHILSPVMSIDCDTAAGSRIVREKLHLLRRLFPELRCVFAVQGTTPDALPIMRSNGVPHIFTIAEWADVFQVFRGEIHNYIYPTAPGHSPDWMRKRLSQTNRWGSMKEGFGRFLRIPLQSREVLFSWFPLFGSDPSGACPRGAASVDATFGRTTLFLPRIKGAIFLTITPAQLDIESGKKSLVRYLSRSGCAAALVPVAPSSPSGSCMHPVFLADPGLSGSLWNPSAPHPGWEIQEGLVTFDRSYRIITARRSIPAGPDAHRRLPLYWLATAVWLLFGLLAVMIRRKAASNSRLPGLQLQLTSSFIFVLLPFLFLGILALERTAGEQSLRRFNDTISLLKETLDQTDRHREYIQTYAAAVMSRLVQRRELHDELAAKEQQRLTSDDVSQNPVVQREAIRLARWGLVASTPMIAGQNGFFLGFIGGKNISKIAFLMNIMRFMSTRILGSLSTASGKSSKFAGDAGKDLLIGMGMEEIQQLLMAATPADGLCRFLVAPNDMSNIALFNMADTLVRMMMVSNHMPRWTFLANFNPQAFNALTLLSSRPHPKLAAPVRVGFSDRLEPMFFFAPPFYRNELKLDGSVDTRNIYDALSPALMRLSATALNAGVSSALTVGDGPEERMVMSALPSRMGDKILFAEIPSGKTREASELVMNRRRAILFAMLLLSILLAGHVATRFLHPLLALSDAAGRIMNRDFTIRLPVDRGDEFGELAASFNTMAQGVEEGRLLSRFVSESVRTAARDTGRAEAARRGEQTEAAVLFAGLGNFKSVLAGTDPALLVPQLNRYLEVMSQVVRDHGGDIDKFIGEKVLAVFFPDRLGGRSRAADRALRSAIAMQARMAQLRSIFDLPLGIGVVEGPLLAGIMGAPQLRLEYTVIGDTVNLASRLSDIAMRLDQDGHILESAIGASGGIVFEAGLGELLPGGSADLVSLLKPLDLPPIKGKTRSVEAYRIDSAI